MKSKKNEISEKNKTTTLSRMEVIIVLDYLLSQTNEKHPAKQIDIINYGIEKYGIEIRRQRIPDILWDLKDFVDEHKEQLPFEIKEVSTGEKFKFYTNFTLFNKEEINTIIFAISNYKYAVPSEYKKIISKFLSFVTNKYDKVEYLKKLKEDIKYVENENRDNIKRLKLVKQAIKNKSLLELEFYDVSSIKSNSNFIFAGTLMYRRVKCYVYKVLSYNNQEYVVGYDFIHKHWFSVPLDKINICSSMEMGDFIKDYNELLTPPEGYKTIDDYLRKNVLPCDIETIEICFKFSSYSHRYVRLSFTKFFKSAFECSRVKNETKKGMHYEYKGFFQKQLFIDWILSDDSLLNHINISSPTTLINELINMYQTKVNKLKQNLIMAEYEEDEFKEVK